MDREKQAAKDPQFRATLAGKPQVERALWRGWVEGACRAAKIEPPTQQEWGRLTANSVHGKDPLDSVVELTALRMKAGDRK